MTMNHLHPPERPSPSYAVPLSFRRRKTGPIAIPPSSLNYSRVPSIIRFGHFGSFDVSSHPGVQTKIPDRVETTARNRSKEEMKVAANLVSFQTSHAGCTLPPSPVSSRGVASDMDRSEKRGIVQEIHPKENVRSVTLSRQDLQPNIFCSVHASRSADELSLKSGSTRHKHWTAEEDEVLKVAVEEEGRIWNVVSKNYFQGHRNAAQCKHLNPTVKRGGWTSEEDALILDRVARGFKWAEIAKELQNRIGESVRARYANWLDPTLKKTEWTEEEDEVLFYQQAKLGNRWARIRRYLPGRSENSIKNRYHNQKNTYKRKQERQVLVKAQLTEIGNTVTMSDAASSSKCGSWVSKAQHGRQKRQKVVLGGLTTNV